MIARSILLATTLLSLTIASPLQAGETTFEKKVIEFIPPEPEPAFAFVANAAWDSRYVLEGRDSLDGDSLFSTTLEAIYQGLPFGEIAVAAWYAWTPSSEAYSELNLTALYEFEIENFVGYFGYNHLRFFPDDAHDHEIGGGGAFALPYGLSVGAEWLYGFDANGSFFVGFLEGEYEVLPWLALVPSALIGFNAGYIPDGHEGANNAALGLEAVIPIGERVEVGAYAAYNWAIDRDFPNSAGDELLKDFFYGGVQVTLLF